MKKTTIINTRPRDGDDAGPPPVRLPAQPPAIREASRPPEVFTVVKPPVAQTRELPADAEKAATPAAHKVDDVRTVRPAKPIAGEIPAVSVQTGARTVKPRAEKHSLGEYLSSRRGYILLFTLLLFAGIGLGAFIFSRGGGLQIQFSADVTGYFAPASGRTLASLLLTFLLGDGLIVISAALAGLTLFALPVCILGGLWKSAQFGFVASALFAASPSAAPPLLAVYIATSAVSAVICALYCSESCALSHYIVRDPRPFRASLSGVWEKYVFRMFLFALFTFLCYIIFQMTI